MKKILIALALCMGVQTQADAQFLKKLGDAIEKGAKKLDQATQALDKAIGGSQTQSSGTTQQTSKEEKMIGQPVKIGQSTLTKYGDNPGMNINWQGLYRISGNTVVTAYFQLINEAELKLSVSFWESDRNYALDQQGRQYWDTPAMEGNRRVGASSIEPGAKALYTFNYRDVPASVKEMQMVLLGPGSSIGEETWGHKYSFRINDAPITILPAITGEGIFGEQKVLIGQAIASLPKAFPYLYDAYTVSKEDDEGETITTVTFTLKGQETMTAVSYDNTTVANITVTTPNVNAKVKDTYYTCGAKYEMLKNINGVEVDDFGRASYQGIFFDEDDNGKIYSIQI